MANQETPKEKAVRLLRKYDALRAELRDIEQQLGKACTDYGRSNGVWGFNKDHLRMQLEREAA
jgi:hypothetical protein